MLHNLYQFSSTIQNCDSIGVDHRTMPPVHSQNHNLFLLEVQEDTHYQWCEVEFSLMLRTVRGQPWFKELISTTPEAAENEKSRGWRIWRGHAESGFPSCVSSSLSDVSSLLSKSKFCKITLIKSVNCIIMKRVLFKHTHTSNSLITSSIKSLEFFL